MTDLSAAPPDSRFVAALRLLRTWWPGEAAYAVRLAATSIFAMYLCMLFELDTPEWAGWTVISVSLATRANSLQKSVWRAVGTIVGTAVALAMVDSFAQDTLAFDIALAAWLALVTFLSTIQRSLRTYGFALMGYTVPIVTLNDVQHPSSVFYTAVDRCSTLILGVACSYASSVIVARGVRSVRRALADDMDAAVESCRTWSAHAGTSGEPPPVGAVLKLDTAIFDAFTEQPSLRTGGRAVASAPARLLHLLTVGLLRRHLGDDARDDAHALLGETIAEDKGEWEQLDTARRDLRAMRRSGTRRVPAKPLALDWDSVQASRNALRSVIAVSVPNAFWYVSNWPPGSAMVTWAALITILYANRDDGAEISRNFLVGALLATAIGLVAHFVLLAQSSSFEQLALVLLPLMMLATIGHSETQAAYGGGFSFLILNAVSPTNLMTYDLSASLNSELGTILGMAFGVACFTFLLPPASAATRRARARRRMLRSLRRISRWPAPFLWSRDAWLARMWQRLAALDADPAAAEGAQALLLVGALLRALRHDDDRLGRAAGRALFATDAPQALARLADGAAPRVAARLAAIATLARSEALAGWLPAPRGFLA